MKIFENLRTLAVKINPSEISYTGATSDSNFVTNILNTVYFWGAIIAVIVIVIAGFFFVTSQDNPQRVERARNAVLYAVIGLVVLMFAVFITNFVIEAI